MRFGLATVAYHEPRFIVPFLQHVPDWVERKVVLNSTRPWFGTPEPGDTTAEVAKPYATVIQNYWPTEEAQRNTGLSLMADMDWVFTMDPDEFMTQEDWETVRAFLEQDAIADAYSCHVARTYWKQGYVADPPEGHRPLIAVRPTTRFVDKRVVGGTYAAIPAVTVHHFSWARTDREVLRKVTSYAEATNFDGQRWYDEVWKPWQPGGQDVHPLTPSALHNLIPAELPPEIEELNLWPK